MAHTTTESRPADTGSAVTALRVLQVFATLTVVNILWQFVSAGTMLGRFGSDALEEAHGAGAIVLHVVSGVAALAALALWRLRGTALWPSATAVVVFVLGFVQAYFGSGRTLYLHVPGAMILTIGAVSVMVWALSAAARTHSAATP